MGYHRLAAALPLGFDPSMTETIRYFVSTGGIRPPLKLVGPLDDADIRNRNSYVRAVYDGLDRLVGLDKIVYGEVHLSHQYDYHPDGAIRTARITTNTEDGTETSVLSYDPEGGAA